VCCDSDCSSACASCNQPGRAGSCSPLASGGQPKNNGCPKEDASTCSKDGTCDGNGGCRLYGSDTVCKDLQRQWNLRCPRVADLRALPVRQQRLPRDLCRGRRLRGASPLPGRKLRQESARRRLSDRH
jgi:hypothetical protein